MCICPSEYWIIPLCHFCLFAFQMGWGRLFTRWSHSTTRRLSHSNQLLLAWHCLATSGLPPPPTTHTHTSADTKPVSCLFLICLSPHDKRSDCIGAHKSVISDGMFLDKQQLPRWVVSWPGWGLLDLAEGRVAPAVKGHSVTERSGRCIQDPRPYIYHCHHTK